MKIYEFHLFGGLAEDFTEGFFLRFKFTMSNKRQAIDWTHDF